MNAKTQERKFKQTEIGEIHADWGITAVPLANENFFECQNGLWRGKKGPFITAHVIRNTNFTSIGKIDFSDIATLEVEQKQFEKRKLNRGDIIIERSGGGPKQPVGRVVYFADDLEPYSFSNFTSRIRVLDTKTFNPKFIFFVLMSFYQEGRTESLQAKTTGIRNLDFNKYKELVSIPLLNLSEQEKIAEVLTKIQNAVENQEKLVKNLKELKSATMAKLFREGINGEPLKQTEIGEMPKSWEVVSLRSICVRTETINPSKNPNKFIEYVDVSAVSREECRIQNSVRYIGKEAPGRARNLVRYRDIIFATVRPTLRRVAMIPMELDGQVVSTAFCVIRAIEPKAYPEFLYYVISSPKFISQIGQLERGASYPAVTDTDMFDQLIPLPSYKEQQKIAKILDTISKKEEFAERKLKELNSLFSSTLNQLMTGKIRVN